MVLLHLLNASARRNDWTLTVAHLNHQLRGKSSDADARLVKRTAKELGWPAVVGASKVREIARRKKLSLEMAARKSRHEFLARTAARLRIRTIALAHHADDQLELFFLRLFRGSGSQGLLGMKWRNPSPLDQRIELVRPLLGQSREVLAYYATENKISFREDASNASLDIQRNRIRHELVPLLKRHYQPALGQVIARVLDITQAEADFVMDHALAWRSRLKGEARAFRNAECGIGNDPNASAAFESLPIAIQRRILQLELLAHGIAPDFDLIEQLRHKTGRAVCVSLDKLNPRNQRRSQSLVVTRDVKALVRVEKGKLRLFADSAALLDLGEGSGSADFDGVQVTWGRQPNRTHAQVPAKVKNCEWFDADRIGRKIVLRHWRPGDRFQPIGMSSAIKLQDFFTNQKVPRPRRHQLVLAVAADNEVFWVEGMRISERFKLTKATNRRLQWRWQRL